MYTGTVARGFGMANGQRAVSRREAMKTTLKAGAYAAPVILSMAAAGGVAAQVTPAPGLTGLFLTNVVNIPRPARGQGVNFAINIVNRGPSVATGIVVAIPFPPGLIFSGDAFDIGNYDGVNWTIPTLGVGAGGSLTLVVIVNASGTLTATLTATVPNPNPGVSSASATVTLVS